MAIATDSKKSKSGTNTVSRKPFFWHATLGWCLLSVVMFWLAFPPVGWWWLAWIAPCGWIRVITQQDLTGRRPLLTLYLAGWLHWLVMTYWVTLPHPLAAVGWLFLTAYLAIYVLGFILLGRFLVHRTRMPTLIAVPLVWVSMELLRTRLFTGFGLVSLSHSQVHFLSLSQIANVTGAYGVSFVVMLWATAITNLCCQPETSMKRRGLHLVWPAIVLLGCLIYGHTMLREDVASPGRANIALIQGTLDTEFPESMDDVKRLAKRREEAFADYSRMTSRATTEAKVDLVIWPESMFWRHGGVIQYDPAVADKVMTPDGMTLEEIASILEVSTKKHIQLFAANCLMGCTTTYYHAEGDDQFNTAAYYDANGDLVGLYHKMHPVMFGEYIPLGDLFPWLYDFSPLSGPLRAGDQPKAFPAGGLNVAPCICFENTVPQLVRRNVLQLEQQGTPATALATLTNDGWFWGSALLDLHLACGVFRSIENRKPMLIAANTGISAHVDACGRVLQATPKRASRMLLAEVEGSAAWSFYTQYGDCFGYGCVFLTVVGWLWGRFYQSSSVSG